MYKKTKMWERPTRLAVSEPYCYNLKEIKEQRKKENILYSRNADIHRCGICGATGRVKREIIETGNLIKLREERYRCLACECTEFIRILDKDEKIPRYNSSNILDVLRMMKHYKNRMRYE
jgi:predicted nucleic-acid-binding Zn-ribbon protein